jgi:hypothetical protein
MQGSEAVLCCAVLCCAVLVCGELDQWWEGLVNKLPALQYIPALDSSNKETPEKQGRLERAARQDGSVQTSPDRSCDSEGKETINRDQNRLLRHSAMPSLIHAPPRRTGALAPPRLIVLGLFLPRQLTHHAPGTLLLFWCGSSLVSESHLV